MTKGAPARIDARSSARVNHEIYFFSTPSSLRSFRRNPLKYCGEVTDPVSLVRFRPDKKSPRMDWRDRPYFFASDSTLSVFREDPAAYAERPAAMVPKPEEMDGGAMEGEAMSEGATEGATKEAAGAAEETAPESATREADAPDAEGIAFIGPLPEPLPPGQGSGDDRC